MAILNRDMQQPNSNFFWQCAVNIDSEVRHHTVSILFVGVRLEGENRFFDTNRKDRNCMLNVLNIKKHFILVLLKLVAKHGAIHI